MLESIGLSNKRFLIAVVIGLLICPVYLYATAPHPVEVTVQVITPVPTPPPVVIETTDITPENTYTIVVGAGGAGGTGAIDIVNSSGMSDSLAVISMTNQMMLEMLSPMYIFLAVFLGLTSMFTRSRSFNIIIIFGSMSCYMFGILNFTGLVIVSTMAMMFMIIPNMFDIRMD